MATKKKADAHAKAPEPTEITSIKGFDKDLKCRGFQYEIGKTYTHDGAVEQCASGFHACPVEHHPLAVFEYYPPAGNRFCEVRQSGKVSSKDTKLASAVITIDVEISIGDLVKRAWDYGAASATGDYGAAMASGYEGRVMGADGNALFAVERNSRYEIISVAAGIVGRDDILPNVWYRAQGEKLVAA